MAPRSISLTAHKVKTNAVLLEWDPYTFSILTEVTGVVHFKDLTEGITMQEQVDEITGRSQWVVMDSTDEKRVPAIIVRPAGGGKADEKRYLMPMHAHLTVPDGDEVHAGDVLAKIPRATTKTKDITGGLPRVVELFEARKPRETAVISEIDGIGEVRRNRQGHAQDLHHRRRWRAARIPHPARRSYQRAGRRARPCTAIR